MSFLVYKSSAGSGKTFTLVKEYLKIALADDQPNKFTGILAITFTNKAASEMTHRILETLEEVSGVVTPMQKRSRDMMQILASELDVPEEKIIVRSRKTLKKIVHNYRDFSVGTIDSFVHKIIRSFAQEMGLNQQFEVELNTDNILRRAIDAMLDKVGIDPVLTKFITQYAESKFDKGNSWKIEDDLYKFSKELMQTHNWYYLEKAKSISLKTYDKKYAALKIKINTYEKSLQTIAQEAVNYGLNGIEKNKYAHKGVVIGYFIKITNRDFQPECGKQMQSVFKKDKWHAGKTDAQEIALIEERKEKLTDYFNQIVAIREEGEEQYIFESLIFNNLYKVALLTEIDKEVAALKKANNLVLISEFNGLVGDITKNEPIPFIYEKLGERYSHFLFDEFQDTSLMQWQNMLPLVENSLSTNGTSLVVGDAKQSIYRWRGGMAEQFTHLPNPYNPYKDPFVDSRAESLQRSYEPREVLSKNYRSSANIVTFNNAFFTEAARLLDYDVDNYYEDVVQEIKDPSSGGLVEFNFVHEGLKDESNEVIFEKIANLIPELQQQGYALQDIAILTKVKKNTPALVEYLNSRNIEVISSESLLVKNSLYVQLIVAVLRHLNHPQESFYMAEVLIRIHMISPKGDFHEVIRKAGKITPETFTLILQSWGYTLQREAILSRPIYELIAGVLDAFHFTDVTDNRLATWLNYVYTQSLKAGTGIFDLLDAWKNDEDSLSIQVPEDVDAVNVMTIHAAKGLDWPVVILAEGNWRESVNDHTIWVELENHDPVPVSLVTHNKKLENTVFSEAYAEEKSKITLDNLNALYVAFTRPAERLYVFSIKPATDFFGRVFSALESMGLPTKSRFETQDGKEKLVSLAFGDAVNEAALKQEEKARQESLESQSTPVDVIRIENKRYRAYQQKLKVKKNYIKWLNSAGERDFGTLVHKAFSFIKTAEDIQPAVAQLIRGGEVTDQEREAFTKLIENVVHHPELVADFAEGLDIKNEAEIILSNGDFLRPDRVVISENGVTVIDFKTGMHKPAHAEQILGYKMKLEEMGYTSVRAKLVYTNDAEVIEV